VINCECSRVLRFNFLRRPSQLVCSSCLCFVKLLKFNFKREGLYSKEKNADLELLLCFFLQNLFVYHCRCGSSRLDSVLPSGQAGARHLRKGEGERIRSPDSSSSSTAVAARWVAGVSSVKLNWDGCILAASLKFYLVLSFVFSSVHRMRSVTSNYFLCRRTTVRASSSYVIFTR
jgi:hypothetical protein